MNKPKRYWELIVVLPDETASLRLERLEEQGAVPRESALDLALSWKDLD